MRGKEVAKPFFHDCVKKMRNGTKVYKGFKAWELNLLGEFKFLLMVILIPRKKNGFDPEFAEIFKAYNNWGGCTFKGYESKINLVSTVTKNKNLFKVLLNKYGIFIFREKMDIEMESTMNDEISTDDEATVFSGEIPSPTSKYFKYDSDRIEEVAEKIIERFILPKLLEEIPVLSVDRITNVSDLNYDSSGYESALTSPSFENSLLSMNSPVNSEGFCENDDNQVKENSLLIETGNTKNSLFFQNFPSTSSGGQLVQTSHGQFSNEQAAMNVLIPELEDTSYSSSFENFPPTSSVGQLIQTPQGQFFNEQAMINVSMPVHGNTKKACLQNLLSMSSVEKYTQNSQEQFSDEQAMINDLISEKLGDYIPASTIDSHSVNTTQNVVPPLLKIPSNSLDHNYSIPDSSIAGNSAGDDRSMACNSTSLYNKFDNTQSSILNQTQLVDFNPNSDLNGSLVHHFSRLSEGCLGISPGTEEINPILEKSEKDYQNTVVVLDPQSNQLGNSEIAKAPWIDIDQNADQNIFHISKFSKSHSGIQFSAKENVNTVLENSMADEQHALSNSSPPFAACGNFHSYFVEVPSLTFSSNSDTNSPADLSEKYLDMPCNINEEDELVLGVLKKKDVFQKYFSLTDIPTRKKDQRYPSVADFSSVGFEILEEMETSDSESDLLGNIAQNMECSTEFVPDPSRLENGSMYYQMFGIPNTDCLNDDMQE